MKRTSTITQLSEGTFRLTEKIPFNDNSGTWESKSIVFETIELSGKEASERCKSWGSNLVFLGHKEVRIIDKVYYYPTFNVFD